MALQVDQRARRLRPRTRQKGRNLRAGTTSHEWIPWQRQSQCRCFHRRVAQNWRRRDSRQAWSDFRRGPAKGTIAPLSFKTPSVSILNAFCRILSRVGHPQVLLHGKPIDLIAVRGWQVSPAELEGVLRSHPQIVDAAVIGVKHNNSEAPKAFVVRSCPSLSEDTVKAYIAALLVGYKQLDGGVCFVDSIPKSPSGKILRKLL